LVQVPELEMSVVSAGNCPFGDLGSDHVWDPVTVLKKVKNFLHNGKLAYNGIISDPNSFLFYHSYFHIK
jgi:hypothetical protein